jgi:hypothetical protein
MKNNPILCLALAAVLSPVIVSADSIAVGNHSFEAEQLSSGGWSDNTPASWQETTPNGGGSFSEYIPGFVADGVNHQGIQSGTAVWQDLSTSLSPNTQYTLTVAIGNRNAGFTPPGNQTVFALQLWDGTTATTLSTKTFDASTLPESTFADQWTTYTTGDTVAAGTLRILLTHVDGTGRGHFDNIRLDSLTVPEPGTIALLGLGAAGFFLRRRKA